MKAEATASNQLSDTRSNVSTRSHRRGKYQRATDSRNRPIRGLRLAVQDPVNGRRQVRRVRLKHEIENAKGEKILTDVVTLVSVTRGLIK